MNSTKLLKLIPLLIVLAISFWAIFSHDFGGDKNKLTEVITKQDTLSGMYTAEITMKGRGVITIEMDADKAPITVTNFVTLTREGFYDGLTFHRIIKDFMMQGGDPTGTGRGGSDNFIRGEFKENGILNEQSHTRGAVSMARTKQYDSARSQFFICQQDHPELDGQYACFGYVTDGMDIVDDICDNTNSDANGLVLPDQQPIIESIRIVSGE